MKPEPLKRKSAFPLSGNYPNGLWRGEDIRSAVENFIRWLEKNHNNLDIPLRSVNRIKERLKNWDFEDVMKQKERHR